MLSRWFTRIGLLGILVSATGCMCVTTDRPGGMGFGSAGFAPASSNGCDSCCDSGSVQGFYDGPGPLSRFFGLVGCGAGGCGEFYVDEWINEPPMDDCCPSHECLQCGAGPLRSLVQMIRSRQYLGGCETCPSTGCSQCAGGHETAYATSSSHGAFQSEGCNCKGNGRLGGSGHVSPSERIIEGEVIESVDPTSVYGPSQNRRQNSGPQNSGNSRDLRAVPTPAPTPAPSSASRLNPAMRRVVR